MLIVRCKNLKQIPSHRFRCWFARITTTRETLPETIGSHHKMDFSFTRNKIVRIVAVTVSIIVLLVIIALVTYLRFRENLTPQERADQILSSAPLIDGYNGFAYILRELANNDLRAVNFSRNLTEFPPWHLTMTDIPRLRAGKVGAQIWSAFAECTSQHKDAVVITLEQIDVIKRLVANYSDDLELATSSEEILKAVEEGKIASLIAVDGGHSIQYSLAVLRSFYELGVRSMALTSYCSNPWAQSYQMESANKSTKLHSNPGLTDFGDEIVMEMNRLGMIVDISHSSVATMKEAIYTSKAPVIFSRSAAKSICNKDTNIPDEVFRLIRQHEGLVMINFFPGYIKCNTSRATIPDVIQHLDYMREKATIDNIGIGSNFDNIDKKIEGLEDVSKFPNLFAALIETGNWSDEDLEKLAGKNFLRVFKAVEEERDNLKDTHPHQMWIKRRDLRSHQANLTCAATSIRD